MTWRRTRAGMWALAAGLLLVALVKGIQLRRAHRETVPPPRPEDWPPVPAAPEAVTSPAPEEGPPLAAPPVPPPVPAPEEGPPVPAPPAPASTPDQGRPPDWIEPQGQTCPATHPVKAKLDSRIYHLPGVLAYDLTSPDRCYRDEAAAQTDGFRRAKQ